MCSKILTRIEFEAIYLEVVMPKVNCLPMRNELFQIISTLINRGTA